MARLTALVIGSDTKQAIVLAVAVIAAKVIHPVVIPIPNVVMLTALILVQLVVLMIVALVIIPMSIPVCLAQVMARQSRVAPNLIIISLPLGMFATTIFIVVIINDMG